MLACLNALWLQLEAAGCNCSIYDALKKKYEFAATIYFLILEKLRSGDYAGLTDLITKFKSLTSCIGGGGLGEPLSPYDPGGALSVPSDIEWKTQAGGVMTPGQSVKIFPTHIGWRIRFFRNKIREHGPSVDTDTNYTWDVGTATLTVFPAMSNNEFGWIQGY
jgi:hypothetical protein